MNTLEAELVKLVQSVAGNGKASHVDPVVPVGMA